MLLRSTMPWLLCALNAAAQVPPASGDYTGKLGPIHLILHLKPDTAGKLAVTLDSPDQGANGIPAEASTLTPGRLTVSFPSLHATYTAAEGTDGKTLTGTWTQGASTPLVLRLQAPFVPAAAPSVIDGDWTGALPTGSGPLPLLLHIRSDRTGAESLTFDSPAQNAAGLIADNVAFSGNQITFDLSAVHGHYAGELTSDNSTLSGTWTQGGSTPLSFTRVTPFIPAAKPTPADGEWTGAVTTPKGDLRLLLHIRSDRSGTEYVTLDSPDQLATGYKAAHTALHGDTLTFDVPQLRATFSGTVTQTALDGTWTQTTPMRVHLSHPPTNQPVRLTAPPIAIDLADLPGLLDAELKPLAENPALAGTASLGVAVGLVSHGERRILTYGIATPASIFEIGSLTKTFTGLLLAQAVTSGTVALDTPLRTLLPPGTVSKPEGPEITLLSLATHHSGLPRLPANFHPANPQNPYADYTVANLDSFIATQGVTRPAAAPFLYSNVGAALLGQALAADAGTSYPALLRRDVLDPLHMAHTFLTVPVGERPAVLRGLTEDDTPASAWDLDAFAPAGGLHAGIADLLAYAEAQLHPPPAFAPAITLQHQLQADAGENRIAISWLFDPASGDFWHNGGTGGFTSYAFFNPEKDVAGVVFVNRASSLADSLGRHVSALLEGRAPTPLRR